MIEKVWGKLELHVEDITLDGIKYDKNRFRQYYTLYNSFNLPSGWGGMLNLMLEPTFRNLDRVYYTVYNVTGNIYKELFKDKLELGLSFGLAGKDEDTPDRLIYLRLPMIIPPHFHI